MQIVIRQGILATLCCWLIGCGGDSTQPPGHPQVLMPGWEIELVAQTPDIVTPIGMAIDREDNLLVLESHTHSPLKEYEGPEFDRIKKGLDTNEDGIPDAWVIFADSINDGMNLICDASGRVLLTEKDRVLAFEDTDGDGISDRRTTILDMVSPSSVYDHAGILGLAISEEGWLYISRGNTGGQAWKIVGTDGTEIGGYGDGGNVMRCRPDGSQLEEVATGFWNPFDIRFSREGRLLLTDNDPDSRGPNRLIEVAYGGDYGYESLYGGSGIHPFLAWNGELPGTLPYAAGLGEAPTGLLDAGFTQLGESFPDNVLAAVWEEKRIVRIPLRPQGVTVTGDNQVFIQGDSTFHPVSLVANSKGELYISDWVVRQYPNHGQGKIWRVRASDASPPSEKETTLQAAFPLLASTSPFATETELLGGLGSDDPFVRTVARKFLPDALQSRLLVSEDAQLRLQALLRGLESGRILESAQVQRLLEDETEDIRRMTLIYIARNCRTDLYTAVNEALFSGKISPALFETYLATIRHLQPDFVEAYQNRNESASKNLPRNLPENFISSLIRNRELNPTIRAMAVRYLEAPEKHIDELIELAQEDNEPLTAALIQVLRSVPDENAATLLKEIAIHNTYATELRAGAIVSLGYQSKRFCEPIAQILTEDDEVLAEVAARYLCGCKDRETLMDAMVNHPASARISEIWQLCSGGAVDRPETDDAWQAAIRGDGDPLKGKWIFQTLTSQCQSCHQVGGWGGIFGPDLSHIGSSKSREQLLRAILKPSSEISPEWQGWYVTDQEGNTHYGRQIDVHLNNVEIMLADGSFETFPSPQSYGLAPVSLMPEGLENMLTVSELNNLITYLMSLQ